MTFPQKRSLATLVALASLGLTYVSSATAGGYVSEPPSRAALCKLNQNADCGDFAKFQPELIQSERSASGFPLVAGIADGGLSRYAQLNAEGGERWHKTVVGSGNLDIRWQLTSAEKITGWKYYITQPNWQQTLDAKQQLTAESFEKTPFCEVAANEQQEQNWQVTHSCKLPARTGYQLIYAVADLAASENNPAQSIYNIIDVNVVEGTQNKASQEATEWQKEIGTIDTPQAVKAGDVIRARFFSDDEQPAMEIKITVNAGEEKTWPAVLANAINTQHSAVRAGFRHSCGAISPAVQQINTIYADQESQLTSAVISIN